MGGALIQTKKVNQEFKIGDNNLHVLHDVTISIPENSFTIIYGSSGSGKSTLLNLLIGLQRPSDGQILYRGKDLYQYSSDQLAQHRASEFGMVFQTNYWVKSLTVLENVALPLYFLGQVRAEANKRAMKALEMLNMAKHAHKLPTLLSGGEQQRVSMARTLVRSPKLIVADEPTGNLDTATGDQIMQLLRKCQSELKQTIILVTHELEYLPLGDHLFHIQDGTVTALQGKDIRRTTNELLNGQKDRIDKLMRTRNETAKIQ